MSEQASKAGETELGILYPVPQKFTIAGREIEIPEASFRQCGMVYSFGMALTIRIAFLPDFDAASNTVDVMRYGEVIEQYPDEAVDLLHAGTGIDREWLASLSALDKCELAAAWVEVNGVFFAQWHRTRSKMVAAAQCLKNGGGSTSSAPLAPTGTTIPSATPRAKSASTTTRASAEKHESGVTV